MKNILLTLCLLVTCQFSFGQSHNELSPCGTPYGKTKWLKDYQLNPTSYNKADDVVLYVPLTIHILGSDGGTGYFSQRNVLDALCVLNEDFIDSEIHFFVEGEFNYINNSAYYAHNTVLEGAEMMFEHNVENTINCYFVSDPAGNCGYNLPYAGMAVAKSCADPSDHTWSHEMGHGLSLPHPFLGWEGGISWNNSINPVYSQPAPDTVLYDYTYFLDTLILDTMIIDTALVEKMDGSNCFLAADGFCDTPPDYLAYRWQCSADDPQSGVTQHDPNNVPFQSDGTLIMSYADDACSYRFSEEQIAAMRANLLDEKPELLYNQEPGDALSQVNLLSPVNSEPADNNNAYLEWEEVPTATHYVVRLELVFPPTTFFVGEFATNVASLAIPDELQVETTYRYTVRPYNSYYFCDDYSAVGEFVAMDISSVNTISGLNQFSIFPNLLGQNVGFVSVSLNAEEPMNLTWNLTDLNGKVVKSDEIEILIGQNRKDLEIGQLAAGVYFLDFNDGEGTVVEKIIVY